MEIILITGLSLSLIAIGVLFYLGYQRNKQLQKKCNHLGKALLALQKEFSKYQVDQGKLDRDDTTTREIRFDRVAKEIKRNEDAIYAVNKKLPNEIRKVVGHIEFARPLDKK